ncbi:hypothetical protein [Streptomyces sp. RK9]|uniref:hypothetical protein n=1 Tax=Streptomyces sp. RK9 TaxID=3239284 RepID=UPI0038661369
MSIITCVNCGELLTDILSQVPFPPTPEKFTGERLGLPLLQQGTYAIDPETGAITLHPDGAPGTRQHRGPGRQNGCCAPDGLDGPNLVCAGCGAEVATRKTDCWQEHLVAVIPEAVEFYPKSP